MKSFAETNLKKEILNAINQLIITFAITTYE